MSDVFFANRFKDKSMIITGAATGIGRETAIRAAKEGARLVLVDRKKEEGQQTYEEILATGAEVKFLLGDLTDHEVAKKMVKLAVDSYGGLDIAINNAGIMGSPSPVHASKIEDMNYLMANNLYTVYFSCQEELKVFLEQGRGGVIVNNASIAGLTGLPGNSGYVASKHAVNGLTKNMAVDYAKHGIRVNSVNPAGTSTPMVAEAMDFVKKSIAKAIEQGLDPALAKGMAGQKTEGLQKREATAKEQAASILFLASDDSSHITGATFATDGGWTAY